jgi:hypothetical protein
MTVIGTEITKSEFLQACNEKVRLDGLRDAEEERRRREEEERLRLLEEERRRREEEERLRLLEEERRRREEEERLRLLEEERLSKENKNWDEWYSKLPNECKNGFVFMEFKYKIDPRIRKITKEFIGEVGNDGIKPINNDDLIPFDYVRFTDGSINKELGI